MNSISANEIKTIKLSIYRFDPLKDKKPFMQDFDIDVPADKDLMVLDVLMTAKEQDPSISFRRSCREGVCGSDGMNINGKNGLGCITPLSDVIKSNKLSLRPLPGLPVIKDLTVNMKQFVDQYKKVKPYLITDKKVDTKEAIPQTIQEREKLDGLYECIMCGCCSTACPSFWWNPDKFLGPAALLQAYRFIADSRDTATEERLEQLEDAFSVFRCHGIMNCVSVCPKGLNPTKAIGEIKKMLVKRAL
jgi:succinate dehydrogenase / fumarate reductase iron-sulfur subunit